MFSPGIEPGTFCVLDRCDNRYTTKTQCTLQAILNITLKGSIPANPKDNHTRHTSQWTSAVSQGRDRLVVRTLRCGRSNPGSNPGHGMFWRNHKDLRPPRREYSSGVEIYYQRPKYGLNRDLNPGPLAPKARIIPLDH